MSPAELRVVLLILGFLGGKVASSSLNPAGIESVPGGWPDSDSNSGASAQESVADATVPPAVTDSTLGDPCVNHTVLDQPWRSTNCSNTECTGGQWMGDGNLEVGWYRFNSSGGWKIPEMDIPHHGSGTSQHHGSGTSQHHGSGTSQHHGSGTSQHHGSGTSQHHGSGTSQHHGSGTSQHHGSGKKPVWLNGPHPNVGEGEVTRTVCFTVGEDTCYQSLEIRVKNCSDYFVYWLKPTPQQQGLAVYCTDSQSDTAAEPQASTTGEPGPGLTTTPAGSVISELETSTLEQSTGLSTGEHTQELSSVPAGDTSSDSQPDTTHKPQGTVTREPGLGLTITTAGSSSSLTDPQIDITPKPQGTATDLEVSTMDQPDGSSTGQPTPSPSSVSVGETSSDLEVSTMDQPDESSTGQPTPSPSSVSVGETSSVTDSTLGDPCVTHTVLDQSWRSTNCYHTECTSGQWMSDGNLEVRWYRFNSSGGWKIPETVVPQGHCSGETPGWLNGPHPNVGEGEVTRTVCFTVGEDTCYWSLEIKVKNCSGYFVYWLKPTPQHQGNAVYCTDSLLDTTWEPQGSTTGEPALGLTTTAAGSVSSDLEVSTMDQPDGSSTGQPTPSPSSVSAGGTSSDPQSDTSQEPQGSATGGPGPSLSTTPAGSASSDPGTSTGKQSEGSSTGDFSQETLSVPAGDTSSGSSTGKQTDGSVSGEHTQKSSSVPAGDTSPGSSTGKQTDGSVSGEHTQKSGGTTSDPPNSKGTSQKPSSGPEGETCSVKGLPSKDECEKMINSAQVLILGQNNLRNSQEQEAYLRQVRQMLIEQLPCKHVLSNSKHDNEGGK
ncbi:mucin-5AC-like [Mobula hypostoma]|uniref:mucin-5AC-like n=1 Tax=Mobula hypostoma TaxID=723540 RepID=UPI002FC33308